MTFLLRLLEGEAQGNGTGSANGSGVVDTVRATLLPRAPLLVRLLLAGAAGALPPARNPQIAAVLYALLKVRDLHSSNPAWLESSKCCARLGGHHNHDRPECACLWKLRTGSAPALHWRCRHIGAILILNGPTCGDLKSPFQQVEA